MSDLLAFTGWIGEHPATGSDVAHLFGYPATAEDPDTATKLQITAQLWGLADASAGIMTQADLTVHLGRQTLTVPGGWTDLPALTPDWTQAAQRQGFVVVTLTTAALSSPTLTDIDHALADQTPGRLWTGFAATET